MLRASLLLVAEKLGHLAVEAAVVVPLTHPGQQPLQRRDDLLLVLARAGKVRLALGVASHGPGRGLQADQRTFDGGGQLRADRGKMFSLEAIELGQQPFQAALEIGVVDAIGLKVGQQAEHLHRQAVAAAGQAAHDLALVELRGLQAVDVGLFQARRLVQPDLQFANLAAGVTLELQHAGQLRQDLALPHGHPLQQLLGRDDGQDPRFAAAGLRVIVGGQSTAGQLHAGDKLKFGQVHGAVDRPLFARCARVEDRGRRKRACRVLGKAEAFCLSCAFASDALKTSATCRRAMSSLARMRKSTTARSVTKRSPTGCSMTALGGASAQHAKLPASVAAALDAVDIDQAERVADGFLHDQFRRRCSRSGGRRSSRVERQAVGVDLQGQRAAVVEPQLACRLEAFGCRAGKLYARAGQKRSGRRCLAIFGRPIRVAGRSNSERQRPDRRRFGRVDDPDFRPTHILIVAAGKAELQRRAHVFAPRDQDLAQQLHRLGFFSRLPLGIRQTIVDAAVGRQRSVAGVDHFDLQRLTAGDDDGRDRLPQTQVRFLGPVGGAQWKCQAGQGRACRPSVGSDQTDG